MLGRHEARSRGSIAGENADGYHEAVAPGRSRIPPPSGMSASAYSPPPCQPVLSRSDEKSSRKSCRPPSTCVKAPKFSRTRPTVRLASPLMESRLVDEENSEA